MDKDENYKKKKIEKLRLILDNPINKNLKIEDKNLVSLHKRILKNNVREHSYLFKNEKIENGSLNANVTIHKKDNP
jgi:hypothetical protein